MSPHPRRPPHHRPPHHRPPHSRPASPGPILTRRWVARPVIAIVLAAGLSACTGGVHLPGRPDVSGARTATAHLAKALSTEDLSGLTFAGGTKAANRFAALIAPLGSARLAATPQGDPQVDGDSATSRIRMRWQLPGATKPWTYTVTAKLSKSADRWQPVWQPSLVQPDLVPGAELALSRSQARRGEIIGGDGTALMKPRPVQRIGIDKSRVSATVAVRSARRLAALLDLDAAAYAKQVKAAGGKAFVQAIVYRSSDPGRPSPAAVDAIDGAVTLDGTAMLAPTKSFAAPILGTVGEATKEIIDRSGGQVAAGDEVGLSGLEERYDARLRGTPELSVSVVPPTAGASAAPSTSAAPTPGATAAPATHPTRVFHQTGRAGQDLRITLDAGLQAAAEKILADVGPASALVAIRPSTGAVVAAANGPGAGAQNIATYGQFPPGSTFKIIDALALLRKGVRPTDRMDCPATITVDGRRFKNYNDYPASALGAVDLTTAFANSCNTAFIGQRNTVDAKDLQAAGASLGLGTDYDVGFPAYFGSIPEPQSQTERAAEMIGQGRVLASPLSMAGVVASVQAGRTVVPHLVDGQTADPRAQPLTTAEVKQLRGLMHAVVTQGSGALLLPLQPPQVIAKTGTAEYGTDTPPKTHAWMVAGRGDLAVAVFVGDGDSGSGVAGPLLKRFLQQS